MAKSKRGCMKKTIVITKKNKRTGRKQVVAEFRGHAGKDCSKRKKPSTRHLGPYKAAFKRAVAYCKRRKSGKFQTCVGRQLHTPLNYRSRTR